MRAFLTVFRVTIAGKGGLLLLAAAIGAVPVVVGTQRPELFGFGPLVQTIIWTGILAATFVLGLSLLGDELAAGRLSFFFGRPVPAAAIWGGKVAGGVVVAVAITAASLLPMNLWWPRWDQGPELGPIGLGHVATPVLGVALGMVAGVLIRGRSRWSILDGVALAAVPLLWIDIYAPIETARTHISAIPRLTERQPLRDLLEQRVDLVVSVLVLAAIVGGLAASAAALSVGRASARRAHAAASVTLWSILLPTAACVLVYAHWFLPV